MTYLAVTHDGTIYIELSEAAMAYASINDVGIDYYAIDVDPDTMAPSLRPVNGQKANAARIRQGVAAP